MSLSPFLTHRDKPSATYWLPETSLPRNMAESLALPKMNKGNTLMSGVPVFIWEGLASRNKIRQKGEFMKDLVTSTSG